MTKNPLSLEPTELTERVAKAIKSEAGDRLQIKVEPDPYVSGFDRVKVIGENAYLIVAVGRGLIELPLHSVPVPGKNHVKVTAYLRSFPDEPMLPHCLEGALEQQYDDPETAIETALYFRMLDNAEKKFSQIAEILNKSVLD